MASPESVNWSGRVNVRRAWAIIAFIAFALVGGFLWKVNGGSMATPIQHRLNDWIPLILPFVFIFIFAWASNWRSRLYGGKLGVDVRSDNPGFSEAKRLKRREMTLAIIFFTVLAGLAAVARVFHW